MEKLIKRQDAIDVVAKAYEYDRLTALQELPTIDVSKNLDINKRELIKRQDAIDVVAKPYEYESDRLTHCKNCQRLI